MVNASKTLDGARKILREVVDGREVDAWRGFGFCEITLNRHGDIVTYRVYDSGTITER